MQTHTFCNFLSTLTFWTQESTALGICFSFGSFSPDLTPSCDRVNEDIPGVVVFSGFLVGSRKTVTNLSPRQMWCFSFFNTLSLALVETLNTQIHTDMGVISNNPLIHAFVPRPSTLSARAAPCILGWWDGVGDVKVLFITLRWVAFYCGNENSMIMEHCPLVKSHVSETVSHFNNVE